MADIRVRTAADKSGDKLRLTDLQYNEETPQQLFLGGRCCDRTHPMGVSASNFGYSYIIVSEEVFDAIHLTLQKREPVL